MKESCCASISIDFEAEYHRQIKMIMELQSENKRLRDTIIGMCECLYGKGGAE